MAENWVEKAVREIAEDYFNVGEHTQLIYKKDLAHIILSHAPVIDAQKIAEIVFRAMMKPGQIINEPLIAQLITESMDMDIKWEDGKAEWGRWKLLTIYTENNVDVGYWFVVINCCGVDVDGLSTRFESQELAQQAAEKALKKILTGGADK